MQPYRLIGAIAFAIASALYVALSVASSFDRLIHVVTAVLFGAIAFLWFFTYFRDRSRRTD